MAREPWIKRMKYVFALPPYTTSPTGSAYKTYDIVEQGAVIQHQFNSRTLYSTKPFKITYLMKGKDTPRVSRSKPV